MVFLQFLSMDENLYWKQIQSNSEEEFLTSFKQIVLYCTPRLLIFLYEIAMVPTVQYTIANVTE